MDREADIKLQAINRGRNIKKGIDVLIGMITGMMADGQLNDLEIGLLRTWLTDNEDATTTWPGSFIKRKIDDAIADGFISDDERDHLKESLSQLAANDFSETRSASVEVVALPFDDCSDIQLGGAKICLTGEFLFGPRKKCEEASAAAGAVAKSSVTRTTDFLVVGTNISPHWRHTSLSLIHI